VQENQPSDPAQIAVQKALSRENATALNLESNGSNQTLVLDGSCKTAISFVAAHEGIFDEWDRASQVASKKAAACRESYSPCVTDRFIAVTESSNVADLVRRSHVKLQA
jgi:hypothetical protein